APPAKPFAHRRLRLRQPRPAADVVQDSPPSDTAPASRVLNWSRTRSLLAALGFLLPLLWSTYFLERLFFSPPDEPELPQPLPETEELFTDLQAVGVVAIGHAEGNLTLAGDRTAAYWGHADPGNFRQNQGWCSDQGRGGGDPALADRKCLERVQERLPQITADFYQAGLDPAAEPESMLNAVDLYNQASPWVSRQFPQKYALALEQGRTGEAALVWARVEAFRRQGKIDASGLIGICRREARLVTDWQCVAQDQRRRIQAISRVLGQGELSSAGAL
ncbi:MAG: hypothetical protein ACPGVO_02150, partial [Spirulinaceae cyanobacterium]